MSDAPRTTGAWIRALSEQFADRTLIVLGRERLSYRDAEQRSARMARGLLAHGVGKGTRVGLLLPNGPDWVIGWLAATRIGALLVPLNTFYQARELGFVLRHADVDTLLTADAHLGNDYLQRLEQLVPGLAAGARPPLRLPELPFLRHVRVWGAGARPWSEPGEAALAAAGRTVDEALLAAVEAGVAPADPMVVIYSSGSTAEPKGAIHAHGALIQHAANLLAMRDLLPDDRVYSPMPFFWVGGFVFTLLCAMHVGACLVAEERFEPGATLELLERERVSVVAGWPHYGKAMSEHPSFASRDLSAIRGGNLYDLLPREQRFDPQLRHNSLGMTETAGPHSFGRQDVPLRESQRGSFGPPVPGMQHRILDPQTGAPLGPGQSGEICVRGETLMLGLYKQRREDTFDADGWYHTGDAGFLDAEGLLHFEARLGELIKTGGANVTPQEVEAVLAALPGVAAAHVVGLPDPARGENVAAAIVLRDGVAPDAEALRSAAKGELAAYKLPRHWFFLAAEELPFTASGKLDRKRLRAELAERTAR